ncbi:MAG: ZIP family metal transporter [Eubacteriales bacterium]|nr:ZIP family metal transporter [Eubacteriales bacterium]
MQNVFWGLLLPFLGTTLGAGCVFFVKTELKPLVQKSLLGFASGVMVAASVWSLLIPAMEMSESMGRFAFVPACAGVLLGMAFLLLMDHIIPHLHMGSTKSEGPAVSLKKTTMLVLAVTLHNIPEGMAVGIVFVGMLSGSAQITLAGAFALSVGIAVQNFPEGAIISLPLRSEEGMSRRKAFFMGTLSGIVEPIFGGLTILLASYITPVLPYLLSFAAGAMLYVVVEELIPEASRGEHSDIGTIGFTVGFVLMMVLDVALG